MRITHDQVSGMAEFQMLKNYRLFIPQLPSGLALNTDEINLRCQGFALPQRSDNSSPEFLHGFRVNQHGLPEYGTSISLDFIEDVKASIMDTFNAWMQLCCADGTGISSPPAVYKRDIHLILLDGEGNATQTYLVKGAYPVTSVPGSAQGNSADRQKPKVEFKFDYHTPLIGSTNRMVSMNASIQIPTIPSGGSFGI